MFLMSQAYLHQKLVVRLNLGMPYPALFNLVCKCTWNLRQRHVRLASVAIETGSDQIQIVIVTAVGDCDDVIDL